jgi:uncharacterized membrane protein YozB (DUF420 family)
MVTATAPAAVVRVGRGAERWFFGGMAWAMLATMVVGFSRTFFLRAWFPEVRHLAPTESFFYFHGAVFTAWFVLLVVQPALIATRRVEIHRRVGWFGCGLAALMCVVGIEGALIAARRPGGFLGIPIPPAQFLIIPFGDILLFAIFVGLAVARRRDVQAHKRYMLIASTSLITAAVARVPLEVLATGGPIAFFLATDLFLVALVVWDLVTRRRLHPATLIGTLVLVASQPLRLALSGSAAWQAVAGWLIG